MDPAFERWHSSKFGQMMSNNQRFWYREDEDCALSRSKLKTLSDPVYAYALRDIEKSFL
jgi:hypothetical protein